jgi:hypothetical protein
MAEVMALNNDKGEEMDSDKRESSRAYSRGYAAGRKRTEEELRRLDSAVADMNSRSQQRRDQFFCAALTGLIAKGGWTMDGKPVSTSSDYIKLASIFADHAMKTEVLP